MTLQAKNKWETFLQLASKASTDVINQESIFILPIPGVVTAKNEWVFGCSAYKFNLMICVSGLASNKPFQCLASNKVCSFDFLEKTQCLPLYRYDKNGSRSDNITDWALHQFREHYKDSGITKEAIFRYVYAVLHYPAYREKYALNLKREFPRIPFYDDFWKWETWGHQLMDFHLNYETANQYPLQRIDLKDNPAKPPTKPRPILKADKPANSILLDSITTLKNIPPEAWEYKLGNRSALEWVLEYYKERKPKDPTIRQKFNTYRFADYKEPVIDLLARVCTVSVETMRTIRVMSLLSSGKRLHYSTFSDESF